MKGVIIGKFVREYPDKTSGEMKKSRELAGCLGEEGTAGGRLFRSEV